MGLWLERYSDGKLISRARFIEGRTEINSSVYNDVISIDPVQAAKLAKASSSVPLEQRDWVLRIGFTDE